MSLDALMKEVRAVRELTEEAVSILRAAPASRVGDETEEQTHFGMGGDPAATVPTPAIRARKRKTVLLIDDDPAALQAARAALETAEVPTRIAPDGNAGLASIAQEKPDVIVMELDVGGVMAGKDVINMIKATMEWVDIPIVLYTRLPIENQKEARQIHGADEFVSKAAGPASLVARVVTLFRRA